MSCQIVNFNHIENLIFPETYLIIKKGLPFINVIVENDEDEERHDSWYIGWVWNYFKSVDSRTCVIDDQSQADSNDSLSTTIPVVIIGWKHWNINRNLFLVEMNWQNFILYLVLLPEIIWSQLQRHPKWSQWNEPGHEKY